jgi:hypothetical protein
MKMSYDEAYAMIDNGQIKDAKTIMLTICQNKQSYLIQNT